jgi:hypothetical protein
MGPGVPWPPPAPAPTKKRRWPRVVLGVVVLLVVLIGAVALLGNHDTVTSSSAPPPTLLRGAAAWVAPDGSFGAAYPTAPTLGPSLQMDSIASSEQLWWTKAPTGVYGVEVEHLKGGHRIDVPGSLSTAVNAFARGYGTSVMDHARTTTANGQAAETFSVSPKVLGIVARGEVVITSHAFYIIFGEAPEARAATVDAFIASLRVPT